MARYQERSSPIASAVFRIIPGTAVSTVVRQLARRDRWVFLLLDGRRTVRDIARLTHHSEEAIAPTLAHFLRCGYIEQTNSIAYRVGE